MIKFLGLRLLLILDLFFYIVGFNPLLGYVWFDR